MKRRIALVGTLMFVNVLRGDIIFGPDIEHVNSQISYGGDGRGASGWLSPGIFAATAFNDPITSCYGCQMEFTSGDLRPGVSALNKTTTGNGDTWTFNGGGTILMTGYLPGDKAQRTLFSGALDSLEIIRCDVFDPGEVCVNGSFTITVDPQLADIYQIPHTPVGGTFNQLIYYVEMDRSMTPGCDPHLLNSCGPFPPQGFYANEIVMGRVNIDPPGPTSTPEPATISLLGTLLLLGGRWSMMRK